MAAIIAQITRAKRERDKKKTYQTEKCMWVIYFPRRIDNQKGFVGLLEIFLIWSGLITKCMRIRVAEVAREHGWHPPKSLDSDENFKPEHTLFCRELRFVAIYALFGDLWAKKVPFWVKNSVSWARSALLHGIYCIFHWVNFANLRLRAKTTHLTRKLWIRAWQKFSLPFLLLTKGCQVLPPCFNETLFHYSPM